MIKEKLLKVKISSSNWKYYEKYKPYNVGDIIEIKPLELPKNSKVKITAICDICGDSKKICYQGYRKQYENGNFYCCRKCFIIKSKITNNERYGVDFIMQNENFKNKNKNTLKEKYGINNISQLDSIRKIRSERLKDPKYQDKLKKSIEYKYNIDNISKLESIKEKKIKTTLKNYGVENPSQSSEIFIKSQKSGKKIKKHECGLYYRGSYEKDFLDICFSKNIKLDKGLTIKYIINNKNKYYHSDYYLKEKNLIIEIKSDYYYEKYKQKNLLKKEYTIKNGYNYILILNKNYKEFFKKLNI